MHRELVYGRQRSVLAVRPMAPRVMHATTRVGMAAEEYWALRLDQGFDLFCAELDKSTFEPIERRTEKHDGKSFEFMECLLLYKENPVPKHLQHMMGARALLPALVRSPVPASTTATATCARAPRRCRAVRLQVQGAVVPRPL